MTEKDFRRLVTDLEITKEEKEKLQTILSNLESTISNNLSKHFELINVLKGGAWAKGTMAADTDEIDILVVIKSNLSKEFNLVNNACLNEIENIIIYEYEEIIKASDIEINTNRNIIKIKLSNIIVNLMIRYDEELTNKFSVKKDLLQIEFTELANRDYTYFRNAMIIIKYYRDENHINISGYNLEILLYYSLNEYFNTNRYESYLYGFIRAIDDFTNYKKIEVSKDIYQKLNINYQEQTYKKGFVLVDLVDQANITSDLTEVTVNEYRKLKKVLAKFVDTMNPISSTAQVIIDINPILNSDSTYSWSYKIQNTNIYNNGGSYQKNTEQYFTAILKGLSKALRAVVDNNLNRKGIKLICNETNIFKKASNFGEENRSRIRTIQAFMDVNNITITEN